MNLIVDFFKKIIFNAEIRFFSISNGRYIGKYGVVFCFLIIPVAFGLLSNISQDLYRILTFVYDIMELAYGNVSPFRFFNIPHVHALDSNENFQSSMMDMRNEKVGIKSSTSRSYHENSMSWCTSESDWKSIGFRPRYTCNYAVDRCRILPPRSYIIGIAVWSDGTSYPIGMPCPEGCLESEWASLAEQFFDKPWYDLAFVEAIGISREDCIDLDLYEQLKLEAHESIELDRESFFRKREYDLAIADAKVGERVVREEFYDDIKYQAALVKLKNQIYIDPLLAFDEGKFKKKIDSIVNSPIFKLWQKKFECEGTLREEYIRFVDLRDIILYGFGSSVAITLFVLIFFGADFF